MRKRFLFVLFASVLLPRYAVASDLNGMLGQAESVLDKMKENNAQSSESKGETAPQPAAPNVSEQKSNASSKADEEYDLWLAEQKRKEEQMRREEAAGQKAGQKQQLDVFEAEQRREEEEKQLKAQKNEEEIRRWEEETRELDRQFVEKERQRGLEAERQTRELDAKAEAEGRARGLIPAPFGQGWGDTNFDSSKMVNREKNHNVETFAYMSNNVPANTDELSLLICDGAGLQKVLWQSARYDAWTVGTPHKEMKAILIGKYGNPTVDNGLARIYWAGASGTGVVLVANQFSNQNINLQVVYDGPKLAACLEQYNRGNVAGF